MADTVGIGTSPTGGTGAVLPTAPSAPVAEFVTPPPAAAYAAALLAATVQNLRKLAKPIPAPTPLAPA